MSDKRALIVDDDPLFCFSSSLSLEMGGFEVWEAYNGKHALEVIETEKKRKRDFDLFLVDLLMPVMDGLQLIREIHKIRLADRAIVVSGSIDDEVIRELESFECNNWLAKPFTIDQLMDAVRRMLGRGV